jgi:predicted DNA-binding transcriptional regulator AlpA
VNKSKEIQGSTLVSTGKIQLSSPIKELREYEGGSAAGLGPLLLTAKQAAAMCGKSLRTWRSWDAAGRIPRPVRIGRSTLWRAEELREWVTAGCPCRSKWEACKHQHGG